MNNISEQRADGRAYDSIYLIEQRDKEHEPALVNIRRAHEYVYVMKGRVTIKTPSGITFVCIQVKENSLGGFTADDAVVY